MGVKSEVKSTEIILQSQSLTFLYFLLRPETQTQLSGKFFGGKRTFAEFDSRETVASPARFGPDVDVGSDGFRNAAY